MMAALSGTTTLLTELAVLLRLTRIQAQVARLRRTSTEGVRRELAEDALKIDARAASIQITIRLLGGTPDILADAVSRVATTTRSSLERGQPFSEALLADLALQHQLRDRAVFIRLLAQSQDQSAVVTLMQHLEEAHTKRIASITLRAGQVAQGCRTTGPPTPAQAAVSTAARIVLLPSRQAAALFNVPSLFEKAINVLTPGRGPTERTIQATNKGGEHPWLWAVP